MLLALRLMLRALFRQVQDKMDKRSDTLRVRDHKVVYIGSTARYRRIVVEGTGRLVITKESTRLFCVQDLDMLSVTTGGIFIGDQRIPL